MRQSFSCYSRSRADELEGIMDFLTGMLSFGGWLVAVVILFRAWRKFRNQESRIAFAGFLLVFGGIALSLLVGTILSTQAPSRGDLGVAFYFLGIPRLVGLVGTIVVVYVFWVIVMGARNIHLYQKEE